MYHILIHCSNINTGKPLNFKFGVGKNTQKGVILISSLEVE